MSRAMDLIDAQLAQSALQRWRYQTEACPVCNAKIHTADCALLKVLAALALSAA